MLAVSFVKGLDVSFSFLPNYIFYLKQSQSSDTFTFFHFYVIFRPETMTLM